MRRITMIALGFALLLSGTHLYAQTNSGVEKALQAKEQAGWQAWKDHNAKPFEEMLTENAINIANGNMTKGKQQNIDAITKPGCDVKSFALSDFSYTWLNRRTVLMTYTADQDATCSGKTVPGKVFASSLWQKQGGKWLTPFHQETPTGGM